VLKVGSKDKILPTDECKFTTVGVWLLNMPILPLIFLPVWVLNILEGAIAPLPSTSTPLRKTIIKDVSF